MAPIENTLVIDTALINYTILAATINIILIILILGILITGHLISLPRGHPLNIIFIALLLVIIIRTVALTMSDLANRATGVKLTLISFLLFYAFESRGSTQLP